ncbi:hypothetical protein AV903_00675 [Erwinia tracheiphila]|uniref:Uncharacterized protein n=1 Tax=Erwinia tracheiphila TaxID=65700 RepID=A0A345CND6_9GAMM|nr:hypothetical protein AV903_00675 [Erwinia tracheiphila]
MNYRVSSDVPPVRGTQSADRLARTCAYGDQGADTKSLPGYKNQQMTDKYNDDRSKNWTFIAV